MCIKSYRIESYKIVSTRWLTTAYRIVRLVYRYSPNLESRLQVCLVNYNFYKLNWSRNMRDSGRFNSFFSFCVSVWATNAHLVSLLLQSPILHFHSGYQTSDLAPVVRRLYLMLLAPADDKLRAIRNKYAHKWVLCKSLFWSLQIKFATCHFFFNCELLDVNTFFHIFQGVFWSGVSAAGWHGHLGESFNLSVKTLTLKGVKQNRSRTKTSLWHSVHNLLVNKFYYLCVV